MKKHLLEKARLLHETLGHEYLRRTGDDELLDRLKTLTIGTTTRIYSLKDQVVFRARIGDWRTVQELTYPPPEILKGYGRANGPGESRFYCATLLAGAIEELRANLGEKVSILVTHFDVLTLLGIGFELTSMIGSHPIDFEHALDGRLSILKEIRDPAELIEIDMANAFAHQVFTSPGSPEVHRLTALMTKHLLEGVNVDGLMFPSSVSRKVLTHTGFGSGNIVLPPPVVDSKSTHTQINVFEVASNDGFRIELKAMYQENLPQ